MKIEKITENKIRIIVDLDDLEEKNINLHSLMSNSIETQSLFVDMLDEAEKKVGFSTKNSKIAIEALASSEGIFIFTITKDPDIKDLPKRKLRVKRKALKTDFEKAIYKFTTFEDFCNYCTYINAGNLKGLKGLAKNTSLYLYEDTYYLVISDISLKYPHLKEFYASLAEFAKLVSHSSNFESKLIEYGKPIMKRNAIKRCTDYFC
jgi:adapter protein MecA 1/2